MKEIGSIGVFDSGVGGLTIWNDVVTLLPNEDTIYLADSLNAPYGGKSTQTIIDLCIKNTEILIARGAKMIVVACNTATTQAISTLRGRFDIPFVGVEPAIKPASLKSKSKYVGVLATKGTINSAHFTETKELFSKGVNVVSQEGTGLVQAIEKGNMDSLQLRSVLKKHLAELKKFPIDYLVLGCTHYPFLRKLIVSEIGTDITILDSGAAVAKQVKSVLTQNGLTSESTNVASHDIISSGNLNPLKQIMKTFNLEKGREIIYSSLYQSE
jgi:glutamate racemase